MPAEEDVLEDRAAARLPRAARPFPREEERVHEAPEARGRPGVTERVDAADFGIDVAGVLPEVSHRVERLASLRRLGPQLHAELGDRGELRGVEGVAERLLARPGEEEVHLPPERRGRLRAHVLGEHPLEEPDVGVHEPARRFHGVHVPVGDLDPQCLCPGDELGEERVVRVHHADDVREPEEVLGDPARSAEHLLNGVEELRVAAGESSAERPVGRDRGHRADGADRGLPLRREGEEEREADAHRLRPAEDAVEGRPRLRPAEPEDAGRLAELPQVPHRLAAGQAVQERVAVPALLVVDDEPALHGGEVGFALRELGVAVGPSVVAVASAGRGQCDEPPVLLRVRVHEIVHALRVLDAGLCPVIGEPVPITPPAGDVLPELVRKTTRLHGESVRSRVVDRGTVGVRGQQHVDEDVALHDGVRDAVDRLVDGVAELVVRRQDPVQAEHLLVVEPGRPTEHVARGAPGLLVDLEDPIAGLEPAVALSGKPRLLAIGPLE